MPSAIIPLLNSLKSKLYIKGTCILYVSFFFFFFGWTFWFSWTGTITDCAQVCGEKFIHSSQMLLFSFSLLDGFSCSAFNFENALKVFYWIKSGDIFGQFLLFAAFKSLHLCLLWMFWSHCHLRVCFFFSLVLTWLSVRIWVDIFLCSFSKLL